MSGKARPRARIRNAAIALFLIDNFIGVGPQTTSASAFANASASVSPHPYAAHVDEAAQRFTIPAEWIWNVMRIESGGNPRALSRAGAIGLMQIMPDTWAELSRRHGLGGNPWNPRTNILAGAAYLRELHDRYGAPGFLAAYNAGPRRYEEWLRIGRALPPETRDYLAKLAPTTGGRDIPSVPPVAVPGWTRAPMFAARKANSEAPAAARRTAAAPESAIPAAKTDPQPGSATSLFVPRSDGRR